jgi:tight adherence protein C
VNPVVPAGLLATLFLLGVRGVIDARDLGDVGRRYSADSLAAPRESRLRLLLTDIGERMAPSVLRALPPMARNQVSHMIDAAGRPGGLDLTTYAARKGMQLSVAAALGLLLALGGALIPALVLVIAAGLWEDIRLSRTARLRQEEIERSLPDFMDVIGIIATAGVGFRDALVRVAEQMGGPLAEELMTTMAHLDLGASRREAFGGLADRNRSETMSMFVTSILQAEELGAPLAETLAELALDMRRTVSQEARKRAARAGGKISLIVSMLFVPAIMIMMGVGIFLSSGIGEGGVLGG